MVRDIEKRIYEGGSITFEEALTLGDLPGSRLVDLLSAAHRVNQYFNGSQMDFCSIINARSGRCTEDCTFCAQSSYYRTNIKIYPLLDKKMVLERALRMESAGVQRYSLVVSGRGMFGEDFNRTLEIYSLLQAKTKLKLCASLGILEESQLKKLKEVGVTTYHHNLETSLSYYRQICTTHSYEERVQTVKAAQRAGLRVCSGGIIGLGESWKDRMEMAFALKRLRVASVPVNILHPIPGTPLEKQISLFPEDIFKTLAVLRLILPKVMLRLAGGRENALGDRLSEALQSGVSALLVGSYLTTSGQTIEKDRKIAQLSGFVFDSEK